MFGKIKLAALVSALVLGAIILSCSEDSNYDQRTVVYVSSINENMPFLCDVLNQGDSLYMPQSTTVYKEDDDYVTEDRIQVVFHNKPYNGIVNPENGALGDFLVTGYDVEFISTGGSLTPVASFSGTTSILVPADDDAMGYILLVPFSAKNLDPLNLLKYSPSEIMAQAHITFHGHEVQTDVNVDFETMILVSFADPLTTTGQQNQGNP